MGEKRILYLRVCHKYLFIAKVVLWPCLMLAIRWLTGSLESCWLEPYLVLTRSDLDTLITFSRLPLNKAKQNMNNYLCTQTSWCETAAQVMVRFVHRLTLDQDPWHNQS